MQTVGCSTCHDPHGNGKEWQLRMTGQGRPSRALRGKPAGLSATCEECHNARTSPADAAIQDFPHYSSVAEILATPAAWTYGQAVPNSPHGVMVGAAPVPNPAAKDDPEAAKFLFSAANDTQGNTPGACVACHMYPHRAMPRAHQLPQVGSHSFNMVSPDGSFDYTAACQTCHADMQGLLRHPGQSRL